MKPLPFMVSVQWGSERHYFQGGTFTMQAAVTLANGLYERLWKEYTHRPKGQGPKPRVMIWELRGSVQDDSVGPLVWNIELSNETSY